MRTLRRSPKWLFAGVCLVLALPARAADVDKLLPDDTDVVISLNVKQLTEAPLVKKLFLEKIRDLIKSEEHVQKRLDALGFDPTRDLESASIAVWDIMPQQEPKFLTIFHGKFDPAKIQARAEEEVKEFGDNFKIEKEGDYTYYAITPPHNPQDKRIFIGVMDKSSMVISMDKDAMLDAFAKNAGKKKGAVKPELKSLIEKADAKLSGWLAVIPNAWSKLPEEPEAKKVFDRTESIVASLAVDKEIKINVTFAAKSTDGAKELAEELKADLEKLKTLLAMIPVKQVAAIIDVIGAMTVEADGSKVVLKSEVSEELVEKNFKD